MAVVQHLALENYWYWLYWWLDIAMHTAGGLVIGLIATLFVTRWSHLILAVLVIGVLWEVFEYVIGISLVEPNFALDTSLDLLFDVIGGLIAWGIMRLWLTFQSPSSEAPDKSPAQTSSSP